MQSLLFVLRVSSVQFDVLRDFFVFLFARGSSFQASLPGLSCGIIKYGSHWYSAQNASLDDNTSTSQLDPEPVPTLPTARVIAFIGAVVRQHEEAILHLWMDGAWKKIRDGLKREVKLLFFYVQKKLNSFFFSACYEVG